MQVAIASGKGGTGKTTLATNLAAVLSVSQRVTLLDCDVEEPNDHLFLQIDKYDSTEVTVAIPQVDGDRCTGCGLCSERCAFNALGVIGNQVLVYQELCHSCGGCGLFCPENAITERPVVIGRLHQGQLGRLKLRYGMLEVGWPSGVPLIKQVRVEADRERLTIIDAPPGTSCSAVAAVEETDFCIMVTEPTPYGLHDLKLAIAMADKLRVPVGVVINRSDLGDDRVKRYCREQGIPVLLEIPFSRKIAAGYARGQLFAFNSPAWQGVLLELWARVEELISDA